MGRIFDDFLFALTLAVACYVATFLTRDYLFVGDLGLAAQDRVLALQADTQASKRVPPFVLLDIDDDAFASLGYPPSTPFHFLAQAINLVVDGNPRLLVVDVDIGWSQETEATELKGALQSASAKHVPVLIVRQPLQTGHHPTATRLLRSTAVDDLVTGSGSVFWTLAVTPVDGDGISRRYSSGGMLCRNGNLVTVPGIQLAGCLALEGEKGLAALRLATASQQSCGAQRALQSNTVQCAGWRWPLIGDSSASSRIVYSMRWKLPPRTSRPQVNLPRSRLRVEEVQIVNAVDAVEHAATLNKQASFGDRVVIIGSSAEDAGDNYRTSLGAMPGMLVVANGIRSAVDAGPIYSGDGFLWGLAATVAMTLVTVFIWLVVRVLPAFQIPAFKFAAFLSTTILWFTFAGWALAGGQIAEFIFPQYFVAAYLMLASGWREDRK